jgi:hypothetical protein
MSYAAGLFERVHIARAAMPRVDLTQWPAFAANCRWVHDVSVATPRLLIEAAAAPHCAHTPLADYYLHHAEEERDHAAWFCGDFEDAGIDLSKPDLLALAFAGSQYWLIKHRHPACLLGYLASVEGDPVPMALVEQLEAVHGAAVMATIRYHAVVDVEHQADLAAVIDEHEKLRPEIELGVITALHGLGAAARAWGNVRQ